MSNWVEISGGATIDAPCGISIGADVNVFVRATDNRIFHSRAVGGPFGPWVEFEGRALTPSGLSAVIHVDELNLFARGIDNRIYRNRARVGGAFGGWREVEGGGLTLSGPSAVDFDGIKTVFVRGTDNRIYFNEIVN